MLLTAGYSTQPDHLGIGSLIREPRPSQNPVYSVTWAGNQTSTPIQLLFLANSTPFSPTASELEQWSCPTIGPNSKPLLLKDTTRYIQNQAERNVKVLSLPKSTFN